jgi:hypothetical protein
MRENLNAFCPSSSWPLLLFQLRNCRGGHRGWRRPCTEIARTFSHTGRCDLSLHKQHTASIDRATLHLPAQSSERAPTERDGRTAAGRQLLAQAAVKNSQATGLAMSKESLDELKSISASSKANTDKIQALAAKLEALQSTMQSKLDALQFKSERAAAQQSMQWALAHSDLR